MLRVAIIGCGRIADSHTEQLRRIPGCEVVGVCDREPLMAKQLCDRFQIRRHFSDVQTLLDACQPSVVHIATPPENHFDIGRLCLERGCHIYVEKPFTLNLKEAQSLIGLAERIERKVTVGHDLQFSPVARRMRQLVQAGFLGGQPVHMESYYCYDLSDPRYARALLADKQHWIRRLPGKLLHNIISHGIARIAEFLKSDSPEVICHGFVSPLLRSMGEAEIVDELRVIISRGAADRRPILRFPRRCVPALNGFRLYGPKNGLIVDEDQQTLIKCRGARYKSYAERFIPPLISARQQIDNLAANARRFLASDFHMKSGMKCLIESFYQSIGHGTPLPVSYREILLTSRIMDAIFEQLNARSAMDLPVPNGASRSIDPGSIGGADEVWMPGGSRLSQPRKALRARTTDSDRVRERI